MKLDYDNRLKELDGIKTVVFYNHGGKEGSWSKYLPSPDVITDEVIEDCKSSKVLYYGSSKQFDSLDFPEYNFSYLVNKYKFNSDLKITDASKELKELIGKDSIELDKIENVLFPTVIESDDDVNYSYFGSLKVGQDVVYLIKVPEWVDKIELYDEILEKDFIDYSLQKDSEAIPYSIKFGPDRTDKRNLESRYPMYYDDIDTKEDVTAVFKDDYNKLLDEVSCSKIVLVIFSTDNNRTTITVNISYSSWLADKNPERNKYKYTLRNDEYYSTIRNLSNISKYGDIYFDAASGTMLGCKENKLTRLLEKKIKRLNSKYSPYVNYSRGDVVTIGDNQYISLIDNNVGLCPDSSWSWAVEDEFNNKVSSNTVDIIITPSESANVIPEGTILVTDGVQIEFTYESRPDYEFLGIKLGDGSYLKNIEDYEKVRISYGDGFKDIIKIGFGKGVWDKVLSSGAVLIIEQERIATEINMYSINNGIRVPYPFEEPELELNDIIVNGEILPKTDWSLENYTIKSEKLYDNQVQYVFKNLSPEKDIQSVTINPSGSDDEKELKVEEIDTDKSTIITITDTKVDYKSGSLLFHLVDSDIIINIIQNFGVEFSLSGFNTFTRNTELKKGDLMFYYRDDHVIKDPVLLIETADDIKHLLVLSESDSIQVRNTLFTVKEGPDGIFNILADKLTENIRITIIENQE